MKRHGHTAATAFRDTYDDLDLDKWFELAGVEAATRTAIRSWRGSLLEM